MERESNGVPPSRSALIFGVDFSQLVPAAPNPLPGGDPSVLGRAVPRANVPLFLGTMNANAVAPPPLPPMVMGLPTLDVNVHHQVFNADANNVVHPHQPNLDEANDYQEMHEEIIPGIIEVEAIMTETNRLRMQNEALTMILETLDDVTETLQNLPASNLRSLSREIGEVRAILTQDNIQNGLSEEVIRNTLIPYDYQVELVDHDSCSICMGEFLNAEVLGKINCDHKFHFNCIMKWLKVNNICPICRIRALAMN